MKFQISTGKWSSWLNPRNALKKRKMCSKEVFDPRTHLEQSWVMTTNQKGRISIWTFVGRNLDRALSDHTRSHQHLHDWSMLEHKFVLDLRLTVNWVQKISAAIFFCIWPDQDWQLSTTLSDSKSLAAFFCDMTPACILIPSNSCVPLGTCMSETVTMSFFYAVHVL